MGSHEEEASADSSGEIFWSWLFFFSATVEGVADGMMTASGVCVAG